MRSPCASRSWPRAAAIRRSPASSDEIEGEVKGKLMRLLTTAAAQGEISRDVDCEAAIDVLMALGDGISWRRAIDPSFKAETALPLILAHGALPADPSRTMMIVLSGRQSDESQSRCCRWIGGSGQFVEWLRATCFRIIQTKRLAAVRPSRSGEGEAVPRRRPGRPRSSPTAAP